MGPKRNREGHQACLRGGEVARAAADGYTLFLAALPQIAILPVLNKVPYDPVKDFAPISEIATNPFVLAVSSSFPAGTLSEFVAAIRAQPGKFAYASVGAGTLTHLSMATFLKRAGLEMIHVGYKSATPMSDVIAGHVTAYFAPLSDALAQRSNGAVRLLAVSNDKRIPEMPDVPTIAESGFPAFRTVTWTGLMAPADTPKAVIDRIAAEIARAAKDPGFADRLRTLGVDPLGSTPEEFAATISADIGLWANVIRDAGVKEH